MDKKDINVDISEDTDTDNPFNIIWKINFEKKKN